MVCCVVVAGITSPTKQPYQLRVENLPISVTQPQALQLQQSQHLVPVSMLDQGGRPILIGTNNASLQSPWQQAHRPPLVLGSWQPSQAAAALASLPSAPPAHQRPPRVGDALQASARGLNDAWARQIIVDPNGLEQAVVPIVSVVALVNVIHASSSCNPLFVAGHARVRAPSRAERRVGHLHLEPAARQPAENGRLGGAIRHKRRANDGCRPPAGAQECARAGATVGTQRCWAPPPERVVDGSIDRAEIPQQAEVSRTAVTISESIGL